MATVFIVVMRAYEEDKKKKSDGIYEISAHLIKSE